MSRIARTITNVLTRTTPAPQGAVHFHGGPQGAYVCENARCDSPGLDPADS